MIDLEEKKVSLIICTRNRSDSLHRTLETMLPIVHDNDQLLEILVMDNGSTDETSKIVERFSSTWKKVRYSNEPEKGLCRARNKAVVLAQGAILVWTDDDLVVTKEWIPKLVAPILANEADCVVGRIEIAEHLRRDWMQPFHRLWLAENIHPKVPQLIGANMAIRKDCFKNGALFDIETGPGALGYMDDTLQGMRLRKSGRKIIYRDEAMVTHHFDIDRLNRKFWIKTAERAGRSTAYVSHHWDHAVISRLRLRILFQRMKLTEHLLKKRFAGSSDLEGIGEVEFGLRKTLSYLKGMHRLRGIPYKY
jgi:glycosyltransferase involved in cell wall biosynthesis